METSKGQTFGLVCRKLEISEQTYYKWRRDHVWSYAFVHDQTSDGRPLRMLTLIDEHSRECLTIDVKRRLNSEDVIDRLTQLFCGRGTPDYIRSDNGAESTYHKVRDWLEQVNVKTLFITPGSPWENGYIESFNRKLGGELLKLELFDTLAEAQVLIERWRRHYNLVRPHSSLGYRSPAPETMMPSRFSNFATLNLKNGLLGKLDTLS